MTHSLIFLVLYILGLAIITFYFGKKESEKEYLNSSKSLGVVDATWTTFASIISGFNIVLGVTFSYIYGVWYLMAFVGAGLAFFTFYYLYRQVLNKYQLQHDFLSIADYFGEVYGPYSRNLVSITILISLILFLTVQISVNTSIFALLFSVNQYLALVLTTGAVAVYLYFGGFKISVKTDILQGLLMLPIILTVIYLPNNITFENFKTTFDFSQFWFAVGLTFLQYFSLLGQAEAFQRVFATRNLEVLKKSLKYSFVLACLLAGSVAYMGITLKLGGGEVDVQNLFVTAVLPSIPDWLRALLGVSFVAAFMGTIDSASFAFGSVFSKTVFRNDSKKYIQGATLGGIVVGSILSITSMGLLSVVFAFIALIAVVGAAFIFSYLLSWQKEEVNVFLTSSVAVFILGQIFKFVTDDPITSTIPIVSGLVCVYLYKFLLNK